jgi:hypothetical protein
MRDIQIGAEDGSGGNFLGPFLCVRRAEGVSLLWMKYVFWSSGHKALVPFPPSFNDGLEAGLIYESQLSHSSLAVGVVVHRDHSLRRDHMLREM